VRLPAYPRPDVAVYVGKLWSPLDTAAVHLFFRAVVRLEPDAERAFNEDTRVGRATQRAGRSEPVVDRRRDFGEAAGIAELGRSLADEFPGDGIEIRRPAGILSACVHVNVQLRPVPLQSSESLVALDQIERSVGVD
jgi:hypothetical protein